MPGSLSNAWGFLFAINTWFRELINTCIALYTMSMIIFPWLLVIHCLTLFAQKWWCYRGRYHPNKEALNLCQGFFAVRNYTISWIDTRFYGTITTGWRLCKYYVCQGCKRVLVICRGFFLCSNAQYFGHSVTTPLKRGNGSGVNDLFMPSQVNG